MCLLREFGILQLLFLVLLYGISNYRQCYGRCGAGVERRAAKLVHHICDMCRRRQHLLLVPQGYQQIEAQERGGVARSRVRDIKVDDTVGRY